MKRTMHLAVAAALLAFGAHAGAQVPRPPKPPTVVKTPPGPPNSGAAKVNTGAKLNTGAKVDAAAKVNVGGAGAQKADKAAGAGSLAPPPPGNAAIKGEAGAIKGSPAAKFTDESPKELGATKIKGNSAIKGEAAIKGESQIGGAGAIKGEGAIKGVPAVQSPAAR